MSSDKKFFVVGGEYADISFSTIVDGKSPETFGPFTKEEALNFWRDITGKTVDNAMVRYVVKGEEELGNHSYYVVGGEYGDPTFTAIAPGKSLETYGPFSKQEALNFWRSITGRTVDSCLHRYDILPR